MVDLQEQLMKVEKSLRETESRLQEQRHAIISLQQKLEIRNLSLERLQAQFTTAADTVSRLLDERQRVRNSRWLRLGRVLGLGPAIGDDLP
jgi:Tfp pilus assembly protein FimV